VWLKAILTSLTLTEDFLNRLLDSAQKTVARVLLANAKVKLEHIHLLVFAPSNRTSRKQIWGFFSVERLEDTKEDATANDHTIEIYLYLEGAEIPAYRN